MRLSAAATSAGPPLREALMAASSAEVPAFCEPPTSDAARFCSMFSAVPMTPAFWRSLNGWVVEAKNSERTSSALWLARQSRDASTAIVIESSSQLAIARSPLARPRRPAANHLLAS